MKLVNLDQKVVLSELGLRELSSSERERVWQLIENIFETRLLDFVLFHLSFEDQKEFILISQNDERKAWKFLQKRIDEVEVKIKGEFGKIKEDLKREIEGLQ